MNTIRKRSIFAVILTTALVLAFSACSQIKSNDKAQVCFADEVDKAAYESVDEKIIGEDGSILLIPADDFLSPKA